MVLSESLTESSPYTAEIGAVRAKMYAAHQSGHSLTATWRVTQLQILYRLVHENHDAIRAALYTDLGKEYTEATCSEIMPVQAEINDALHNVHRWMQPRHVPSPSLSFPSTSQIVPMPLAPPGILIIGPSNYPFSLTLHPAVGALAAGNPVLLKPSDLCPSVSALFFKLVAQYFANETTPGVQCILANVPKTTCLLSCRWGCIFFTGSQSVGKIVAAAAAQTLTPTILELGGKSPCVVDETCPPDIQQVAHRIIWAKLFNTGQTCAAVDYVLVHESKLQSLLKCLIIAVSIQYPKDTEGCARELGRMVCRAHAERQMSLLQEIERSISIEKKMNHNNINYATQMLIGGSKECNVSNRYIAPTIIVHPPEDSRLLQEEIFGPILPILVFKTRSEAIQKVRDISGMAPLCLYVFTKSEDVFQEYVQSCRTGGIVRNDCLVHLASKELPFGGLGRSGYGRYHSKYTFDIFSQILPMVYRPCARWCDLGMARYHPYAEKASRMSRLMNAPYIPRMKPICLAIVLCLTASSTLGRNWIATSLEKLAAAMRTR